MQSLNWFWSVGRFDPAWVQAVSGELTALFAFASFALLCRYALDTYRLAKSSVEQIAISKSELEKQQRKAAHVAYDLYLKVQADINALMASVVDGTFGSQRPADLYPDEWPDAVAAFRTLSAEALSPAMRLGIALRTVDFALRNYFRSVDTSARAEHLGDVHLALRTTAEESESLLAALPRNVLKEPA